MHRPSLKLYSVILLVGPGDIFMNLPKLASFEGPVRAMVQGASRGLGLGFVEELLKLEQVEKVFATCRVPAEAIELSALAESSQGRLVLVALDVTEQETIEKAARAVMERVDGLELIINVAGILHDASTGMHPEKKLADLDPAHALRAFQINALGPALVVKHFLPLLRSPHRKVIANLSARVGSIGDNQLGGWYAYRASKAAQNMFTRTIAIELGRHRKMGETICVALHPGTVDTDLSKPFQGNVPEEKLFSQARAVEQLLAVIDKLKVEDSGSFIAWDGQRIPW